MNISIIWHWTHTIVITMVVVCKEKLMFSNWEFNNITKIYEPCFENNNKIFPPINQFIRFRFLPPRHFEHNRGLVPSRPKNSFCNLSLLLLNSPFEPKNRITSLTWVAYGWIITFKIFWWCSLLLFIDRKGKGFRSWNAI